MKINILIVSFFTFLFSLTLAAFAEKLTKEQIEARLQDELARVKIRISEMENTIKEKTQSKRNEAKDEFGRIKERQAELEKDLKKLKSKTGSAWEEFRAGLSRAVEEFNASVKKATDKFK